MFDFKVFDPPQSYIDYRCYVYGLSGPELAMAQHDFYKKKNDLRPEIIKFHNWLCDMREQCRLPVERIEVREADGKKHGRVESMMIFDIEYYLEGGRVMKRKVYVKWERNKATQQQPKFFLENVKKSTEYRRKNKENKDKPLESIVKKTIRYLRKEDEYGDR